MFIFVLFLNHSGKVVPVLSRKHPNKHHKPPTEVAQVRSGDAACSNEQTQDRHESGILSVGNIDVMAHQVVTCNSVMV